MPLDSSTSVVSASPAARSRSKSQEYLRPNTSLSLLQPSAKCSPARLGRKSREGGNGSIFSLYRDYREDKPVDQQQGHRLHMFNKIRSSYAQSGTPGRPTNVRLSVLGATSLLVKFSRADVSPNAIATRYKVEWSMQPNFRPVTGETILSDLHHLECEITGLECGTPYYARVTSIGPKGFGRPTVSEPPSATPSDWREVCGESTPESMHEVASRLQSMYSSFVSRKGGLYGWTGPPSDIRVKRQSDVSSGSSGSLNEGGFNGGTNSSSSSSAAGSGRPMSAILDSTTGSKKSSSGMSVKRGFKNFFSLSLSSKFVKGGARR